MSNGVDQLSAMLTQLLAGAVDDSTAGGALKMFGPMIQQALSTGINGIVDSAIDARDKNGNKIKLSNYSRGKNYVDAAYQTRLRDIAGTKGFISKLEDIQRDTVVRSAFKALGYSDKAAEDALTTGDGFIAKALYLALDKGETGRAYNQINAAIARRFDLMDAGESSEAKKIKARKDYTKKIIGDISDDFFRRVEFGSSTLSDISELTSKLVGTGKYDNISGDTDKISKKLRKELKAYNEAFDSLRSVFEGDFKQTVAHVDRLTGGSVMSLSSTQLKQTADLYQHVALVTGVSDKKLLTLAQTMYTQGVSQAGGDERFASNAAAMSAYLLTSREITSYGASQVGMERLSAHIAGKIAASGENRDLATAYTAYRMRNRKANSEATWNEFQKALESSGKSVNEFGLEQVGGDSQRYADLYSSRVVDTQVSDASIMSLTYKREIDDLAKGYKGVQDTLMGKLGFTEEQMKQAFGDNWRKLGSTDIQNILTDGSAGELSKLSAETRLRIMREFDDDFVALVQGKNIAVSGYGNAEEALKRTGDFTALKNASLGDVDKYKKSRLSRSSSQALVQQWMRTTSSTNLRQMLAAALHATSLNEDGTVYDGDGNPSGSKPKDTPKPKAQQDNNGTPTDGEGKTAVRGKNTVEEVAPVMIALLMRIADGVDRANATG